MQRTIIRLYVPHRGYSYACKATTSRGVVDWIGVDDDRVTESYGLGSFHSQPADWQQGFDELRTKLEFLNDLLHSGLPWDALVTCRNSSGLFGAIIEATESRRSESSRGAYRRKSTETRESSR